MTRRRKPAEATLRERAMASAADRYQATLDQVAAEQGIEPDSDLCEHIATLRLMRQAILARSLRAEILRTDPDDLLKIDAALKAYQPAQKGPQISVHFLESVQGTYKCAHCGERNYLEEGMYTPAAKPKPFQFRCECGRGTEFSASGPFEDGGDRGKPIAAPEPAATPNGVTYREG